jgi:hypothetical protein
VPQSSIHQSPDGVARLIFLAGASGEEIAIISLFFDEAATFVVSPVFTPDPLAARMPVFG